MLRTSWQKKALCAAMFLLLATPVPTVANELSADADRLNVSEGWLLDTSIEIGVLERDLYLMCQPRLGYLSKRVDVVFTLPLQLRLWDIPPADAESVLVSVLRRRGYSLGEQPVWTDLSRLLVDLRYGEADDLLRVRAGHITHSLGHGSVLWRFSSTPDIDRRHGGLVLLFGTDAYGLEAVVGDILAPQQLSGARLYVRPLSFVWQDNAVFAELARRFAVGAGYAADFVAPLNNAAQNPALATAALATTPIVHTFVDAEALLADWNMIATALYADAGARYGVDGQWSTGSEFGLMGRLRAFAATLSLRLGTRLVSIDYRPAEFDAFYFLEREYTLAQTLPKALREAPGGVAGVFEAQLALGPWLQLSARYDDAPGFDNSNALLAADLELGPVRAAAAVAQRGFEGLHGALALGDHSLASVEVRVQVWEYIALLARYWRSARVYQGMLRLDNDVLVGIEVGALMR